MVTALTFHVKKLANFAAVGSNRRRLPIAICEKTRPGIPQALTQSVTGEPTCLMDAGIVRGRNGTINGEGSLAIVPAGRSSGITNGMDANQIIFACAVTSAEHVGQACLLAESIRAFAGRYSGGPIWVLVAGKVGRLSDRARQAFDRLEVRTIHFQFDADLRAFPFAGKVLGAAAAEQQAIEQTSYLAWMDPDSLVIQEPHAFVLGAGKDLGCRPVDHILIGSPYDQALDPFWRAIYQLCDVSPDQIFPMTTSTDQIKIRPYINAGLLIVRPEVRLLSKWRDRFGQSLATDRFEPFFEQKLLYKIFLHQAILAGVILTELRPEQIAVLPHLVNYPLHMHQETPKERRPGRMNELISGRYDTFFKQPAWSDVFPSDQPLRDWLDQMATAYGLLQG